MKAIQLMQPLEGGWELGWDALAAIATLAAVLVSLYLARRETVQRHRDERRRARAIAEPLADELRAIHYRLEQMAKLGDLWGLEEDWLKYQKHLSGLLTPVFDRFSQDVQLFDGETAAVTLRAYGNLIRTRDLLQRRQPAPMLTYANKHQVEKFVSEVPELIEPIRGRVREAVLALWKYTPHAGKNPFHKAAEGASE